MESERKVGREEKRSESRTTRKTEREQEVSQIMKGKKQQPQQQTGNSQVSIPRSQWECFWCVRCKRLCFHSRQQRRGNKELPLKAG